MSAGNPGVNEPGFQPDAGVPADQGLSGLGMLMQWVGGLMAIAAVISALTALSWLSSYNVASGWMFLIALISCARSLMHRRAGAALIYSTLNLHHTPQSCIRRYVIVAWFQSFVVGAIAQAGLHASMWAAIGVALGLALWPGVLVVIFLLPRFRRFRTEIPATEDRGFEGVAIYNTLFGVCAMSSVIVAMFFVGGEARYERPFVVGVLLCCLAAHLVRSGAQVYAGLGGLGTGSFARACGVNRGYVVVSFVAAAVCTFVMLLLPIAAGWFVGMVIALLSGWALLIWPQTIRGFFAERQFSEFMNSHDSSFRRSPDGGVTWLGWLLIGIASVAASCFLIQLIGSVRIGYGDTGSMAAPGFVGLMVSWLRWFVPLVVLPAWAGRELVCMTKRARTMTAVFCVVAAASGLSIWWPAAEALRQSDHVLTVALSFALLGLAWAFPIATWMIVRRPLPFVPPTAIARLRSL